MDLRWKDDKAERDGVERACSGRKVKSVHETWKLLRFGGAE